uniref:Uncharacterized protein n=1 Tax=Anguilla anguilla TaxID=7936 RepID=A0A0E9RIW3_ANGAN
MSHITHTRFLMKMFPHKYLFKSNKMNNCHSHCTIFYFLITNSISIKSVTEFTDYRVI